jgi:RNA polymerase sigma factor (sigma-70 family)
MPPADSSQVWNLESLRAADQAAWRAAFVELWRIASGVISRKIFSKHAVDDVAQETLAIVAQSINSFASEGHMRAMTGIIAQRKAAHFLRDQTAGKRDRRREVSVDAAAEIAVAEPAARLAMDLDILLAQLDPADRVVLEGHFIEGHTSQELATLYNLNANTVRGRIKRAMEGLRTSSAYDASVGRLAV